MPAGVTTEEIEVTDPSGAARPEEATATAEVFAAISALPDDFRDAILAIDVVGLSSSEAARALRVREGTVTSRLYRARAQVAKELGGAGA